ncbi:MAG: AAA family ATPase [Synergistaceae bacterium]|nr:AAA family ATPase [Synergistaceae bacterium]
MAINRVEIKDFLVFKGEFAVDFCSGVNVIIGGNGTGKTTLLKVLYAACEFSRMWKQQTSEWKKSILDYFSKNNSGLNLALDSKDNAPFFIKIFYNNNATTITFEYKDDKLPIKNENVNLWNLDMKSIFIPTTEMLSHSKGFLALNEKYKIPFDATQIDIVVNAELPEARELPPVYTEILEKINHIIHGKVVFEDDTFFIQKDNGKKIEFSFEAEGFRKFGVLEKLIRNGLLEKDSILFWDEPECNINPELMSYLVDILLDLQMNGVQIFVATHSEIFASYFPVCKQKENSVMFHSLYKDGEYIKVNSNDRFDLLEPNKLTEEPVKLYEKELDGVFGDD